MNNIKSAVILAAGMGTRLRSVTNNMIPKGFLVVNGQTLVARSIKKLRQQGIEKIYIVTGNLSEFYEELAEKNNDIVTYKNEEYSTTGSMASLAILRGIVNEDFVLLESDIIYENKALANAINNENNSCVMISGQTNSGDEYYIELKEGVLYKASKDKSQLGSIYGEWVGISKISNELFQEMVIKFDESTNRQYGYEDCIIDASRKVYTGYEKVEDLIWGEIDDESHLKRINEKILPKLELKGEEHVK